MKLYTEKQVKDLLKAQRENCYVAVLKLSNKNIASAAIQAPLPGGDSFDEYYGIDPESLFKEDLEDRQLQGNYDRFCSHRESAKESYNKYVPKLNDLHLKIANLKELIVSLALQSLPTNKSANHLIELKDKRDILLKKAEEHLLIMKENKELMVRYQGGNDHKLFIHWKYLTMLKVTEVPYMKWLTEYKNIII